MPRLRNLSGEEVRQILRDFGFERFSQRGSHMLYLCAVRNSASLTTTCARIQS